MTYCFNSRCAHPKNPDHSRFCHQCGSPLQLAQRFRALQPLGHSGKTLLAQDEQLPSQKRCVVLRGGDDAQKILRWSNATLLRLEALSQNSCLPRLLAVVKQPMKGAARQAQFLIHEWIEGETLAEHLKKQGPLTVSEVLALMVQALQGLERLHQQQVIYGDLRPKTLVLFSGEGQAEPSLKLVSYGALTFLDDPAATHHSPERSPASRAYSAPEFLRQEGEAASDLYSLGMTAIELLTGMAPRQLNPHLSEPHLSEPHLSEPHPLGIERSSGDEAVRHDPLSPELAPPPAARDWVPGDWAQHCLAPVSEGLQLILNQLIQPLVDDRYRTAAEVLEALRALARSPLSRSEGTVSLAEKALSCSLENVASPDFSTENGYTEPCLTPQEESKTALAEDLPPIHASTVAPAAESTAVESTAAENPAKAALEAGEFQAVSTSALVAAVLANPTQLPVGKLIAKMPPPVAQQTTRGTLIKASNEEGSRSHKRQPQSELPNPIALWQQLQQLQAEGYDAADLVSGWIELAELYREQAQEGPRNLISIVIAIAAYEQAFRAGSSHSDTSHSDTNHADAHQAPPILDVETSDHLGRLYWSLGRQEPKYRQQCLAAAIRVYTHAIAQSTAQHPPEGIDPRLPPQKQLAVQEQLSSLYNHLGEAYNDVAITAEDPEQWRLAIQAYESALGCNLIDEDALAERPSALEAPDAIAQRLLAASIQNNLGTACWNLAQHQPDQDAADLLQRAIAAYNQAALIYDPDENAIRYGMIQNNLGTTYLNLGQIEQSLDLLRLAAGTYQVALIYRSRNEAPMSHAATQNNLGAACIQLAAHPYSDPIASREALEQAIVAYEAALTLVEQLTTVGVTSFGFDPTAPRVNLGLAHQRIGMLSEDIQETGIQLVHLETAMGLYLKLLHEESKDSEVYGLVLEYLNQICHYLSDDMGFPQDHRLLKQLPDHLFVEMSRQIQQQIALQAAL